MTNKDTGSGGISKKARFSVFFRWLMAAQTAWSYPKFMGLGYCYAMMPALREIYKGNESGMKKAVKNHLQFISTNQCTGGVILGANISIEEKLKEEGQDAVVSIKTGLMGPLAGIGDTLFYTIIPTIVGSIAAYLALEGNMIGVLIWLAVDILIVGFRYFLFDISYRKGTSIVDNIGAKIKTISEAASVLGLTVVGALIPAVVHANVPAIFKFGEVEMGVQALIDSIMPALIPTLLVFFIYWLLGRKKMNSTKAIIIIVIVSIILGALGIFGV